MSHIDFPYLFSFSIVASGIIFMFISPPQQFRIQILKLAFAITFSFIFIFYGNIHIWLYTRTINLRDDIKKNPGPRPNFSQNFWTCHWNLNSIIVHSYVKISLLKAYLSIRKFDIYSLFVRKIP